MEFDKLDFLLNIGFEKDINDNAITFTRKINSGAYLLTISNNFSLDYFFNPNNPYLSEKSISLLNEISVFLDIIEYPNNYITNESDKRESTIQRHLKYYDDTFNKIYNSLKLYPKSTEYQYIFGEIIDCGFEMTIDFGFYEGKYDAWNRHQFPMDGEIFKVVIIFTSNSENTLSDDASRDFNYCLNRLNSYNVDVLSDVEHNGEFIDLIANILPNEKKDLT